VSGEFEKNMRVIPLGTSSAMPTAERNLSATAVVLEGVWFLFDCGEGTQYRLQQAPIRVGHLAGVFITHLHGDHLYGLPGLLATLSMQDRSDPLPVCGPPGLRSFVITALDRSYVEPVYPVDVVELEPDASIAIGAYRFEARALDHTVPSFGYRLEEPERPGKFDLDAAGRLGVPKGRLFGALQRGESVTLDDGTLVESSTIVGPPRRGRSLAYCTDTRPCSGSVELARGADLLIHEATFGDDEAETARERGHSTAREAATIARDAAARRLLLTHFSSRYKDSSVLVGEAKEVFDCVEAAKDLEPLDVHFSD
jgi:ribonuclease Z